MSHTPGPWSVEFRGVYDELTIISNSENERWVHADVCQVFDTDCDWGRANAQLIAAAPELLEACELLLMIALPHDVSGMAMRDKALAAINKAKGVD